MAKVHGDRMFAAETLTFSCDFVVFLQRPGDRENVRPEKKILPSGYRLQTVVTTVADLMTFSLSRPR